MLKRLLCVLLAGVSLLNVAFGQTHVLAPSGSVAAFKIKNAGFWVDGSFEKLAAKATVDAAGTITALEVTAQVSSITTGIGMRDDHLRSKDYFHAEQYPQIRFVAERFEPSASGLLIVGKLTIKQVTKEVKLPVMRSTRDGLLLLSTQHTLNRRDYGVGGWNLTMSDQATLQVSLVLAPAADAPASK